MARFPAPPSDAYWPLRVFEQEDDEATEFFRAVYYLAGMLYAVGAGNDVLQALEQVVRQLPDEDVELPRGGSLDLAE
jgi:O-phosphoseryl-tRNA(Cys) synthetase